MTLGCRQAVRQRTLTPSLPGFESLHPNHISATKKMHTEKSAIYSGFFAFGEQKFYSKNRRCF